MGISLGDLGSFAVGAIKQDEKNTAEKLVDRRAELEANRQMNIKMKEQKYARDLKKFDEENKKFKSVQSINAEFKDMGEISPAQYGERYLQETNPTLLMEYKKMYVKYPNKLNDFLKQYGNEAIKNFKTTNTIDSLDANRKTSIDEITAIYKTKLEEARGDSFLINKILGDRKKAIATVETVSQDGENGIILANEINKNEENKDDMGFSFGKVEKIPMSLLLDDKEFESAWNSAYNKINFDLDSKNNKSFKYLNKFSTIGGAGELSLKFDKTDSKIVGHNANSVTNLLAMAEMYTTIRDNKSAVNHYNTISKNSTSIAKNFNNDTVFKDMSNLISLDGRVTNISGRISSDGKNKYNLTTIVPLSIVGENNNLFLGKAGNYDVTKKSDMKEISVLMSKFIEIEAGKINNNNLDSQAKVAEVYSDLFMGETDAVNKFKNYLVNNNTKINSFYSENSKETSNNIEGINKTEVTTSNNIENNTTVNEKLNTNIKYPAKTMKNGDVGIKIGNTVYSLNTETDDGKRNVALFNTSKDETLKSAVMEAVKFGKNVNEMSPNLKGTTIPKMITVQTPRGPKRIPNPDHPENAKVKEIVPVKRNINKNRIGTR